MIQPLSYVHPNAKIANNVVIDPFVTIAKDVEIGKGTWIGSNVTIMEGMFEDAKKFNGNILKWNTTNIKFQDKALPFKFLI